MIFCDYVAIGVVIVLIVWIWRIGFREASYDQGG